MSRMEFIPSRGVRNPTKYVEDPYVRVDIEAKDHTCMYTSSIKNWHHSTKPYIKGSYIGLIQSGAGSVNLTETITITTAGYYRFIVDMNRGPKNITKSKVHGEVEFYIDTVKKGDAYDTYNKWDHWKKMDLGKHYLTAGTHTLKFYIKKPALLNTLTYFRVENYSSEAQQGSKRLGLSTIEFTQNSVSELNTADVSIALREDFFRPDRNEFSRMVFDFTDSITIYVGSTNRDVRPMFGGYIVGYSIDTGVLTLNCADRMLDMQRIPIFKNFSIGIPAQKDEDKTWKHVKFASAWTAVDYLRTTCPYGFNTMRTDYSHAFDLNFGEVADYDKVQMVGWSKLWDKRAGNPAPCLRLGMQYANVSTGTCQSVTGVRSVSASATFYEDPIELGYDAATYDILSFQYMAGGVTTQIPLQFNIRITAFKTGETEADEKQYTIIFTGKKTGQPRVIHTYKPTLNGKWQTFKVDLKELLDHYKKSTNYYITKVEFVNTISPTEMACQTVGLMHIDNFQAYKSTGNTKHHLDMAVDYPFDVMQTLCEETNTSIYVDYGDERRDDVLVMQPIEGETLDFEPEEGFNVFEVSNITYQPKEDFCNYAYRHYHWTKKVKKEEVEHTGTVTQKEKDSTLRYGTWENYEDLTDVSSKTDAQKDANKYVEQHCYGYIAFSVSVRGTTLLEPDQYLSTQLNSNYLSGTHAIKSIIHTINFSGSPKYITQIDLGSPSYRFREYMKQFNKRVRFLSVRDSRNMYEKRAAKAIGSVSKGAFVRPYYG